MEIGRMNALKVLRETDIAYLLTDNIHEVFLHKKEALKVYEPGETIDVFLYVDNLGRTTASTRVPHVTLANASFLQVVNVHYDYGVFLDNNLVKDLLLSKDDLPFILKEWPQPGDMIFVTMKEKKGLLFAKIVGRKQIAQHFPDVSPLVEGDKTKAYVQFLIEEGIVCFTLAGQEIFVHHNNTRQKYRLGEEVYPRILKQNESKEYVGSLIDQKESMIEPDSKRILDYLELHHGEMRLTDKSTPEEIQNTLKMSKSAFKRALGALYKSGLVELLPDKTKKNQS